MAWSENIVLAFRQSGGSSAQGVLRSADGGLTWQAVNFPPTILGEAAVSQELELIVAVTNAGGVHLSEDGGLTWNTITPPSEISSTNFRGCCWCDTLGKFAIGGSTGGFGLYDPVEDEWSNIFSQLPAAGNTTIRDISRLVTSNGKVRYLLTTSQANALYGSYNMFTEDFVIFEPVTESSAGSGGNHPSAKTFEFFTQRGERFYLKTNNVTGGSSYVIWDVNPDTSSISGYTNSHPGTAYFTRPGLAYSPPLNRLVSVTNGSLQASQSPVIYADNVTLPWQSREFLNSGLSSTEQNFQNVVYSRSFSRFIVVASGGRSYISSDGIEWTLVPNGTSATYATMVLTEPNLPDILVSDPMLASLDMNSHRILSAPYSDLRAPFDTSAITLADLAPESALVDRLVARLNEEGYPPNG